MRKILFIFLVTAMPAAESALAAPQRIGVAGGVSGMIKATAYGASESRIIKSRDPLFLNDRLVTDGKGKMQILLLDETVFTVGVNSDVVLDEFVYDPSNDSGKVSVKMTKGVFRFVTGKVARKDPANMKVRLSVGTIGIRGTMAAGSTDARGSTIILLGPGANNNANEAAGAITVNNGNTYVLIDQPGYGVTLIPGQETFSVSDMSQQASQLTAGMSADSPQGTDDGPGQPAGEGPGSREGSGGDTSDSGPSVGEEAGQNTAAAGSTLADASGVGGITQSLEGTSMQAALGIISNEIPISLVTMPDGISTWDHVRSIETGLVSYNGTGLCALAGSAGGEYTVDFAMQVDFAARQYGGGASILALGNGETNFSTSILPGDFSDLTGNAAITLSSDLSNIENQAFNNSLVTFNNAGSVAAANATVDVNYSDGMNSGTTQLTANPVPVPPQAIVESYN
ncbi:MAG: hypothetical protein A2021_02105 [Elusimicrobia bacterium GWF2_52_66]|nr:MAG: hypothetical protein A2X33_07815 [Elusimicrobia bacterium GWA2_51_34]OGR84918.1 MAG: hypothetical protein A2021_02105 [Elusimicrobia bacterium GWF2_52_66]HAF95601.1 hypothetical protein [Elusimicrobiota bacterium]HCE98828.1 hypothetical protein [Elusimicrobiota bacterium]